MTPGTVRPAERFARLEDPASDFPFYNGLPTSISGRQWLFVMAGVVLGFLLLVLPIPWPGASVGPFIAAVLLPLVPLLVMAYVAPGHWQALFGKVCWREVRLMLGFAVLNIVVSMSVGAIVFALTDVAPNTASAQLSGMDTAGKVLFFAKTLPQLLGEEIITLLPFLALLQWLSKNWGVGRKRAIVGAWVMSSLLFGLVHLPTYDWNLVQCVVVIGSARMVLTLPWILTKNVWVSTGAHVVNDWLLLGFGLLGAAVLGRV